MTSSSCPSEPRLREFLRGMCDESELDLIAEHLAGCETCERQAQIIEANAGTLAAEVLNLIPTKFLSVEHTPKHDCSSGLNRGSSDETGLSDHPSTDTGREGTVAAQTTRLTPGPPHIVSAIQAAGYEEISVLGRGGMGVVYRARQTTLDRPVAIKVIERAGGHRLTI